VDKLQLFLGGRNTDNTLGAVVLRQPYGRDGWTHKARDESDFFEAAQYKKTSRNYGPILLSPLALFNYRTSHTKRAH
jgi:hypothetical protein